MWANALDLSEIGIRDSVFDLGGDSIAVSRIIATMRSTFSACVSVSDFFEFPTVEKISEFLLMKELKAGQTELAARTYLAVEDMSAEEISDLLTIKRNHNA